MRSLVEVMEGEGMLPRKQTRKKIRRKMGEKHAEYQKSGREIWHLNKGILPVEVHRRQNRNVAKKSLKNS